MKKWLPTAILLACVGVLAALFVGIRVLLGAAFPSPSETAPPVESVVVAPQAPVASVPAAPPGVAEPRVEGPPPQPVRFVARVVEPTYVVVAGDSLWAIAQRHNTTAEAIQSINNLPDRPILSVGQRLVIP